MMGAGEPREAARAHRISALAVLVIIIGPGGGVAGFEKPRAVEGLLGRDVQ